MQVLVVEDNSVNQKLALALLRKLGHEPSLASSGYEAIEIHAQRRFDVILMDVQMPEMDGLEATARIRAAEQNTGIHTPIIALTAHAMAGDRDRFLAAGMDEYLSKPLQRESLIELLDKVHQFARIGI